MAESLKPDSEVALAAMIGEAGRNGTPLEVQGGGSRAALGRPLQTAHIISTRKLAGVRDYQPGELSLTVRAGTPLAEVRAVVEEQRQMLAFEPPDYRRLFVTHDCVSTIGGTVATGWSGPRTVIAGRCGDAVTGLRFVNGRGETIASGGRVMKNVTGYNLARLLCGSFGTLGVISEISLRTTPKPESEATVVIADLGPAESVQAMATALSTPHGVSGAARCPIPSSSNSRTYLRIEGLRSSLSHRCEQLRQRLAEFGQVDIVEADESVAIWQDVRDLCSFGSEPGVIWQVHIRPSKAPYLIAALATQLPVVYLFDQAGAVVWLRVSEEEKGNADVIHREAHIAGGRAMMMRADQQLRLSVPWLSPQVPRLHRLHEDLRSRFDPAGIFNPGRMRTE